MAGLGRRSHYRKHLTDSVLNDFPEPQPPHERIAQIIGSRGGNFFDISVSFSNSNEEGSNTKTNATTTTKNRLALLPTKFRKLVWVKRGDYVIVHCGDDADDDNDNDDNDNNVENDDRDHDEEEKNDSSAANTNESNSNQEQKNKGDDKQDKGVRYMIQHILYKEQVKHLKIKGLWPEVFDDEEEDQNDTNEDESEVEKNTINKSLPPITNEDDHEGEYYDEEDYDDDDLDNGYLNKEDFLMHANANRMNNLNVDDSSEDESEEESSDEE